MAQLYYTVLEASVAAVIMIPLFLILNHFRFHNIKTTLFYLVFALYLAGVYAVVGLPNISYIRFEPNLNLIPLTGMMSDLSDTLLNVVLFIPLGLFLHLLWKPFRRISAVMLFGFCFSLAIEVLQMFTFRATDVNDLITNTSGTLAGYGLGRLIRKAYPSPARENRLENLFLILCLSSGIMFFCQPLIWNLIY